MRTAVIWGLQLYEDCSYMRTAVIWGLQLYEDCSYMRTAVIWGLELYEDWAKRGMGLYEDWALWGLPHLVSCSYGVLLANIKVCCVLTVLLVFTAIFDIIFVISEFGKPPFLAAINRSIICTDVTMYQCMCQFIYVSMHVFMYIYIYACMHQ
jgi:hypothetical protein